MTSLRLSTLCEATNVPSTTDCIQRQKTFLCPWKKLHFWTEKLLLSRANAGAHPGSVHQYCCLALALFENADLNAAGTFVGTFNQSTNQHDMIGDR
jgi:hypothetical protein